LHDEDVRIPKSPIEFCIGYYQPVVSTEVCVRCGTPEDVSSFRTPPPAVSQNVEEAAKFTNTLWSPKAWRVQFGKETLPIKRIGRGKTAKQSSKIGADAPCIVGVFE
jgi:hypothetical protein